MLFDIDKKFKRLGFEKVHESKYLIQYETKENWGIRCLDLLHKASGKHLIQCYQKDKGEKGFARMSGITAKEASLAVKKMKQVGWQ